MFILFLLSWVRLFFLSVEEINLNTLHLLRDMWSIKISNTLHVSCSVAGAQCALFCLVVTQDNIEKAAILQSSVATY